MKMKIISRALKLTVETRSG